MKIFVSTPSNDLADTRKAVCTILDENNIVPLSMEKLIATCEPPWKQLTEKIDEADYLLLIVGNDYGSTDEQGNGYTEKEFNYAEKKEIPILAFIKNYDRNNNNKLCSFKNNVANEKKRTVCYWDKIEEIMPLVLKSIQNIQENQSGNKTDEKLVNSVICSNSNVDDQQYNYNDQSLSLQGFLPNYPQTPIGSCAIVFNKKGLENCVLTLGHSDIMLLFLKLERKLSLDYTYKNDNNVTCLIGNVTMELQSDEFKSYENAIREYKNHYLEKLKEIVNSLQINDYNGSKERKFAYRIIKIKYDFWIKLLEYSYRHDCLNKNGMWDMFSPNRLALNIMHPINCHDINYDGVMHAYFNIENDDEVGSDYIWIVLNLEMTKNDKIKLQSYSKRTIWTCKMSYDWLVNELFPEVCRTYKLNKNDNYDEKNIFSNDSYKEEISNLQMFVIENNIKFSDKEIKCIKDALIYCLSSKILKLDEYYYIKTKLDLSEQISKTDDVREVSNQIIEEVKKQWNSRKEINADYYLRCINAFTDGYSKRALSEDEVYKVYLILKDIIERMKRYKFIDKYKKFYN